MMQAEPGIPQSCSIFSGRAPQPPRPSRRWGAGAALVVLVAVLGIATPEDAQAQDRPWDAAAPSGSRRTSERVILNWSVPTRDGGAPITHYEYRYAVGPRGLPDHHVDPIRYPLNRVDRWATWCRT